MAKFLYIIFIILAAAIKSFGQTASANISATISHPVGTQKINDMDFGRFETGNAAGTIELGNNSKPKSSGGVVLTGLANAAQATINIIGDYVYSVTLPAQGITLKRNGGEETMKVESFYFTPVVTNENQLLAIGATLKVGPSQLPGNYNSIDALAITVNYN